MLLKYWYDESSNTTWVSFDGKTVSWPNLVSRKDIHEQFDQVAFEVLKNDEGRRHFYPVEGNSTEDRASIECQDSGGDSPQE